MTPEELDEIKRAFKRLQEVSQELWLEKQLLRNLIIDSEWMPESELDEGIEKGKKNPINVRQMTEHWAQSEQTLAELGIDDWLAQFDKNFPPTDQV
jgi:hypothetical protein